MIKRLAGSKINGDMSGPRKPENLIDFTTFSALLQIDPFDRAIRRSQRLEDGMDAV